MSDISLSSGSLVVDVERKQVTETIAAVDQGNVSLDSGLLVTKKFASKLNENIKGAMGALSIATRLDPMEQEARASVPVSTADQSLSQPFGDPRFSKEEERPEVEVTELPAATKPKVEETIPLPDPVVTTSEVEPTSGKEDGSTSLRPKIRPEIITKEVIPEVVKAPTVEKAIEVATEEAIETNPDLLNNPIDWIYKQNYMGLNENRKNNDKLRDQEQTTIVGFFKNSLETENPVRGTGADTIAYDKSEITKRSGAWCGAFVDHVLTNLGFNRLQTGNKYDRIRGASYGELGTKIDLDNAKSGDIVVKKDGKISHVGFYVGRFKGISTGNEEDVTSIQQALTDKGFDPKGVDGNFGSNTIAALNAFQKENGLEISSQITGEVFKTLTGKEGTVVDAVLLLGGNQDNEVNVTAYAIDSVTNVRRIGDLTKVDKDVFTSITKDFSFGGSVS